MKKLSTNTLHVALIASGVMVIIVLLEVLGQKGSSFRPLERLENFTYDWRTRLAAGSYSNVSTNLGLIFIDDKTAGKLDKGTLESHRAFGSYRYGLPFPRFIHGDFLDIISPHEPHKICYDIFFIETGLDTHPTFPVVVDGQQQLLHSDDIFANDIAKSGNVILAMNNEVLPEITFREQANGLGHIVAEPDFDGVLRRVDPYYDGKVWHEIFEITIGQASGFPLSSAIISDESIRWTGTDPETGETITTLEIKLNDNGEFDVLDPSLSFGTATSDQIIDYFGGQRYHKPFENKRFWHMGIMMVADMLGLQLEKAEVDSQSNTLKFPTQTGEIIELPLDEDGSFLIPWKFGINEANLKKESLSHFFELDSETADRENYLEGWRGKSILIGSSASGNNLRDISATPLNVKDFAMMTHLNVANALMTQDYIRVVPISMRFGITLFAIILAAFLSLRLNAPQDSVAVIIIGVTYAAASIWIFTSMAISLPIAAPIIGGMGMTHVLTIANRALSEQKEKSRIKRVFGQTVSPNVVNVLLKEDSAEMKGTTENITTVFSDIRGFTDMTDSLESRAHEYAQSIGLKGDQIDQFHELQTRAMLQAVNENLSIQAESIKIYNGTLDKYIGDCVMAFWGAPSGDDQHALHCIQSSVASHKAMLELNVRREAENKGLIKENKSRIKNGLIPIPLKPLIDMGAGINSGKAIVGLVGSTRHISNYTVFGRAVNLAARLEGISGRGRIRIGKSTRNQLIEADSSFKNWIISHPPTRLKGFSKPLETYEIQWWRIPDSIIPPPEIPLDMN